MVKTDNKSELQFREKELLDRIEKMKKTMNETKELETLEHISRLLKEAKLELMRIQEKLAGIGSQEESE